MGEVCINGQVVEKIEFVDASDNSKVLGVMNIDGSQECDNGYIFKVTYKESRVKE